MCFVACGPEAASLSFGFIAKLYYWQDFSLRITVLIYVNLLLYVKGFWKLVNICKSSKCYEGKGIVAKEVVIK